MLISAYEKMEGYVEASDDLEEGEIADSDDETAHKSTVFSQPKTTATVHPFNGTAEQICGTVNSNASLSSRSMPTRADVYRVPKKDSSEESESDEETGCSAMLLKCKRMRYVASHQHAQGNFQNPVLANFAKHRHECGDGAEAKTTSQLKTGTMETDVATQHKRNNVWGNLLQEDSMMQTINSVTVDKPDLMIERDVESYGYNKRYNDVDFFNDNSSNEDGEEEEEDEEKKNGAEELSLCDKETFGAVSVPNKSKQKLKRSVKDRLGKSQSEMETDKDHSHRHHRKRTASDPRCSTSNIYDRLKERTYDKSKPRDHIATMGSDSVEQVVTTLINVLGEPIEKQDVLGRLVEVLGTKKSMELLYMTEDIEEAGGLMTADGSRRRTAGGVFFSLLKSNPSITADQVNEIFKEEREQWKKLCKQRRDKKRKQRNAKMCSGDIGRTTDNGKAAKNGMDYDDDVINDAAAEDIHLEIG